MMMINSHKWMSASAAVLLCMGGVSPVLAQNNPQPLHTITVNGSRFYVPTVMFSAFVFQQQQYFPPEFDKIGEDDDFTKPDACKILANIKPNNCSLTTFPAVPGLPSALGATWAGNGCGAGPMGSALGSYILGEEVPFYSGDLNRPVNGDPAVDFTDVCNIHDACYTGMGSNKDSCDMDLRHNLLAFCGGMVECKVFAETYYKAVHLFGSGAWNSDQAAMKCSQWGNAMKKNGCHE